MKKILFTFLFSSIALSQVMESEEPLLKPLKAKKIMSNESITSDDSGTITCRDSIACVYGFG